MLTRWPTRCLILQLCPAFWSLCWATAMLPVGMGHLLKGHLTTWAQQALSGIGKDCSLHLVVVAVKSGHRATINWSPASCRWFPFLFSFVPNLGLEAPVFKSWWWEVSSMRVNASKGTQQLCFQAPQRKRSAQCYDLVAKCLSLTFCNGVGGRTSCWGFFSPSC